MSRDKGTLLQGIVAELIRVRTAAGLSQRAVAERLGTQQAAISRLEGEMAGRFSLKRLADYAFACGYVPLALTETLELHCIPLDEAIALQLAYPQETLTWNLYTRWKCEAILTELGPPQQYTNAGFPTN